MCEYLVLGVELRALLVLSLRQRPHVAVTLHTRSSYPTHTYQLPYTHVAVTLHTRSSYPTHT